MSNQKSLMALVALSLLIGIVALFTPMLPKAKTMSGDIIAGAPGNLLAENYDPYIMYNGGFNTAKDFSVSGSSAFSGAVALTSSFKLGSSGTTQTNQVVTTCAMKADVSITATSSGYGYCTGVTGVTSSDVIVANFATSSVAGFVLTKDNFWITSAKSSTTAGAIDFVIYNGTGANATPSAVGRMASTTNLTAAH